MRRAGARMGSWLLVVLVSIGTAKAEDPRLSLFEKFNRASTRDELEPSSPGRSLDSSRSSARRRRSFDEF